MAPSTMALLHIPGNLGRGVVDITIYHLIILLRVLKKSLDITTSVFSFVQ